jgi:hypothetical protein
VAVADERKRDRRLACCNRRDRRKRDADPSTLRGSRRRRVDQPAGRGPRGQWFSIVRAHRHTKCYGFPQPRGADPDGVAQPCADATVLGWPDRRPATGRCGTGTAGAHADAQTDTDSNSHRDAHTGCEPLAADQFDADGQPHADAVAYADTEPDSAMRSRLPATLSVPGGFMASGMGPADKQHLRRIVPMTPLS